MSVKDDITGLTIQEAAQQLDDAKISAQELVSATYERIKKLDPDLNTYISLDESEARKSAAAFDESPPDRNEYPLAGIPISVKDVFVTKGLKTTCASNILKDFVPPYDATVVSRIKAAGGIIIGKTNMDEFCHGSSTETSAFGVTHNPHDSELLPGGSSGGSAAAVAANLCTASIGTETGGSIRQPASWCGVVGLKPTYGRTSRYGVIAMASSLDTPGSLTKSVTDAAIMLSVLAGHDPKDATSSQEPVPDYAAEIDRKNINGMTIGIPAEFIAAEQEDGVTEFPTDEAVRRLEDLGATVKEISLLHPKYSIATYTILARSELSSNLARFTGVRYSTPTDEAKTYEDFFERVRGEGFGDEPKRRIMTGTYALSAGYHDKYYKKAVAVRQFIEDDFTRAFEEVDLIVSPSTPSTAMKIGSTKDNPLFGEIADQLLEPSSLAHLPGISIPFTSTSKTDSALPIGIQFIGPKFEERRILNAAYAFEQTYT